MSLDHSIRRVMSGSERGLMAVALRMLMRAAEPVYGFFVRRRNAGYDRRPDRVRWLPRPVISVGNLTAGGTGKTPVVRWLAERLRERGLQVAILSRGYKAVAGELGDEQRMLDRLLNANRPTDSSPVRIRAHPDRFAAGRRLLREHPEIDVFLLDDGFQHRRLGRDLDLVLVNAVEPFGFGRLLPRGLLRESLSGFRRAGAVILTHARSVDEETRKQSIKLIHRHNASVLIYPCVHAAVKVNCEHEGSSRPLPLESMKGRRVFAFCGIGSPAGFEREIRSLGSSVVGTRWFQDHHAYTAADLTAVQAESRSARAEALITTEKDWVKVADLAGASAGLPVWRLDVEAMFLDGAGAALVEQVFIAVGRCKRTSWSR